MGQDKKDSKKKGGETKLMYTLKQEYSFPNVDTLKY